MFYYAGLNVSPSVIRNATPPENSVIDKFSEILLDNITDINIGWNYFLIWQKNVVFLSGNFGDGDKTKSLNAPGYTVNEFICGIAGKDTATLLSEKRELWQYHIYEDVWKEINNFIPTNDEGDSEYIIKIAGFRSVIALTNLGRIFNAANLVEMPKRVKFADIACGFEHTLMLTDNGDIYSMGAGSRGQLGHGDLEDCDEPKLIEALAGLKVVEISAGGWHSAVITTGGDLYTWGWNTNGELGIISKKKVFAIPTVIEFTDEDQKEIEVEIKHVQCGNVFTLCLSEDGLLYGSGSNKYGQLGQPHGEINPLNEFPNINRFIQLKVDFDTKQIKRIKCEEWGTAIEIR